MTRSPDKDDGISNLVQRLDMAMDPSATRIITFISARPGEGTSTVARDYALALSDTVEHKILLIDAGNLEEDYFASHQADPTVTIADIMTAGRPLADALYPIGTHVLLGRWSSPGRGRSAATKLLNDDAFWKNLHESFGAVVIDAPSLKESADGIGLAVRADATVLVVEAEKTRQPVVENLRDTLTQGGAKIAGVVMNKRRYYIPAKVYQNM
ncbi:MAG: hypothetical protein P4M15_00800 [Alphaproteobacteria bacterium]|nr:hypothetical protein [Alphaproteobacteria bacterium]